MNCPNQPSGDKPVKVIPFRKRLDLHRFQTYSAFWKRSDLNLKEKGVIHVLLAHLDKNGECWPTHPQICAIAHIGHSLLEKILNKLRKMREIDWIHWTDEWGRKRNRYVVLSFKKLANPTPTNQVLAHPSKSAGKHSTIYLKAEDAPTTVKEDAAEYG